MKSKIQRSDILYDLVGFTIFLLHLFMSFYGVYNEIMPSWAFVFFFLITRTSMASIGHYHCHRKKDGWTDWGDGLFDF